MAETTTISPLKRQREEFQEQETKRQKPSSSYNQVLCILDDDAELQNEADNDLTSLITTLQQEISTEEHQNGAVFEETPVLSSSSNSCSSSSSSSLCAKEDEYEVDDKEKVMKHLLEASDDELGIPNVETGGSSIETNQDYVNGFSLLDGFGDGFWELEDEAANYYTLLQSELFM